MSILPAWSVIINPATCTERSWKKWRIFLLENHIPFHARTTGSLEELKKILSEEIDSGNRHFLFAGGDGTLHHAGNLILQLAGPDATGITIGMLPSGTGNDWFRTFGVDKKGLAKKLRDHSADPLNVIKISWPDGRERYAFNMVGGALDAAVVDTLSGGKFQVQGSLKYPLALIKTLMKPHKWNARIIVDGNVYEGDWLTLQAGFGKYCGGGMYVLPHAESNRAGLLLMRPKSLLRLLSSIGKLYNGKVADQKEAIALLFSEIEIMHTSHPVPIESDGELLGTSPVKLTVCNGVMKRVAH